MKRSPIVLAVLWLFTACGAGPSPLCHPLGSGCATSQQCCSGNCAEGFCGPPAGCLTSAQCPSGLVCANGSCTQGGPANSPPVARATAPSSVPKHTAVTLDASASSDSDGDPLTFAWALSAVPSGSHAVLVNAAQAQATFTPDVGGAYTATVTVGDGLHSVTASVTVDAIDSPPWADAGVTWAANVGSPVTVAGSGADQDGDAVTFSWSLTSSPPGSGASLSAPTSAAQVTFTPDVTGTYVLTLLTNDGTSNSPPSTVTVTAYPHIATLTHDVVAAAYSKKAGVIVLASSTPSSSLYLYNPDTGAEQAIPLVKPVLSLDLGPDLGKAAVGHDALVSYVDLASAAVTKTYPVAETAASLVLGTGDAYLFPPLSAQWTSIATLDLSTGTETQSGSASIYGGTVAKLHPSGAAMYGATNGLSPDNLEDYAIGANGDASVAWQSPYWGDHPFCGDLWFSQDGARAYTACGNVFNTTPTTKATDMIYAGALTGLAAVAAADHSTAAGKLLVIPGTGWNQTNQADTVVQAFDPVYLTPVGSATALPHWAGPGQGLLSHGHFVFWSADGTHDYVVVENDDESASIASRFGIVTY